MNDAVNLSFRYSKSDIVRAMRSHYASRMRPRLDMVMAVVLAAAGAYLWRSPSSHWLGVFFVGASAAFVLFLFAAFVIGPPLAFRLEPKYRDDYSLTFSPEGIHFRTVHIDSQLQWVCIRGRWSMPTLTSSTMAHGRFPLFRNEFFEVLSSKGHSSSCWLNTF